MIYLMENKKKKLQLFVFHGKYYLLLTQRVSRRQKERMNVTSSFLCVAGLKVTWECALITRANCDTFSPWSSLRGQGDLCTGSMFNKKSHFTKTTFCFIKHLLGLLTWCKCWIVLAR